MKKIVINGVLIKNEKHFYKILKAKFSLTDEFGCNLDALYDELSTVSEKITVVIKNSEILKNKFLQTQEFLELLNDVSSQNDFLKFQVC
ncbi:hypothetical protein LMG7974_00437 [Campylobacter majalis]|uniref:Barstar (barnase inhibitor) domain-containing protein n=1 Tax=Campylobacter majalis TaxID=2790656 RepID=A0ABM8Q448_9BACT|nr:barstar family protein [Campylobacter majalis]CAD7287558.1 hypothetical protein LMG7974_00437 [Campylobacter majalis]